MNLRSGSDLAVWALNLLLALVYLCSGLAVWMLSLSLGFGLPVERHVYNDSSFRVKSSCLGFELFAGLWSAC